MRTTIDLPDLLFRRTKAIAAMRGTSMKDLIVAALEQEVNKGESGTSAPPRPARLPVVHLRSGQPLDLSNFDFDDLLA
jgi:hypothetical protein